MRFRLQCKKTTKETKVSSFKLAFNYIRKPNIETVIIFLLEEGSDFFSCAVLSYYGFGGQYLLRTDLYKGKADNTFCTNIGNINTQNLKKNIQILLFFASCMFPSFKFSRV